LSELKETGIEFCYRPIQLLCKN